MAPPAKRAARSMSAYMIFTEDQRSTVMQELRAAAPDGKVPVTVAAKALGERWKALGEEGQAVYRERAQDLAAAAAAALESAHRDPGAHSVCDVARICS
jgi:HMG (high mobility group) box